MRKVSSVCDYFVIASGTSTTHVNAIADAIEKRMASQGQRLWHVEGAREASWVLLDFSDVVAHIFLEETRRFYSLERLWGDAPQARFGEKRAKKMGAGRKIRVASRKRHPRPGSSRAKRRKPS